MNLPKSLEIIANSDIHIGIFHPEKPDFIAFGCRLDSQRVKPLHIIGPSGTGTLHFSFSPSGKTKYRLQEFTQIGLGVMTVALVSRKNIEIYELHQSPDSLPKDLNYEIFPLSTYATLIR